MRIFINNKLAALKEDTSFEYVSENRLFSGSDGYSLTITFPLKDCPQNQEIFGHINRADVSAGKVVFDCEIQARNFHKFGCITITEITEAEVKTQFLDGRSEQNFDNTLDDVYINELDLGVYPFTSTAELTPENGWYIGAEGCDVCLPWVNESSLNIQNKAVYDPVYNAYDWDPDTQGLSWQIYLLEATKRICGAIGYSYNFSKWERKDEYKFLLICNSLPYSWLIHEYARALPHWSVKEYFEKLELLLGGEFEFDHRAKKVTFAFSKDLLVAKPAVTLVNIIDEHSTEVSVEDASCEYAEAKNLAYKECEHSAWKFYSCDWFIKARQSGSVSYDTMAQLMAANSGLATWNGSNNRGSNANKLLYAADVDAHFIIRTVSRTDTGNRSFGGHLIVWEYKCVLQPVNLLGPRIIDESDDAAQNEIEFVPAWIDFADDTQGWCLFLSPSGYDEETSPVGSSSSEFNWNEWYEQRNAYFAQTSPMKTLEAGHQEKKSQYYDKIYIAWWDGAKDAWDTFPHPFVEDVVIAPDWSSYRNARFSLRLNDTRTARGSALYEIEPAMKTTFKFLADEIPDVRALFLIRGKRYVCEKLTATFSENGMSQLIKGVFYPLKESLD